MRPAAFPAGAPALPQRPLGRAHRPRRLSDADWIRHFGRFEPLPGGFPEPLALRYHGHQFRVYNPEIGDGRGFLFAQMRDLEDGRLLDLGTKGSGRTPWSRTGDGRLTLKGGVREILATEMLEALGVYTSKTFSADRDRRGADPRRRALADPLLGAGAPLAQPHPHRQLPAPGRARPHRRDPPPGRPLDRALLARGGRSAPDPVAGFYDAVVGACARLGAEWFAAGFVHGVLNTDNINITGESFDYGPWRFLDRFDPAFTAAYFDQTGLYCFARQPEALNWNLARLGECLIPISSRAAIEPVFDSFADRFQTELARQTFARLGLLPGEPEPARALMHRFWATMQETAPPFQRVFFDLLGGGLPDRLRASPLLAPLRDRRLGRGDRGPARARPRPRARRRARPSGRRRRRPRDHGDRGGRGDLVRHRPRRRLDARSPTRSPASAATGAFNAALGLLAGPNARPGHVPL